MPWKEKNEKKFATDKGIPIAGYFYYMRKLDIATLDIE